MTRKSGTMLCAGALVAGLAAPVFGAEAGQANEAETLRKEVAQLRAEVAEMRQQENQDWMSERRAEEVKTLIRDVLSDAETRATLLQEGMNAGYDEGFFIRSGDGAFELNVNGQIQARYILNHGDRYDSGAGGLLGSEDDWEGGFEVPRAKLQFSGHIGTPRLDYTLRVDTGSLTNLTDFEVAKIGYQLRDDLYVWGGQFKNPFLREEMVSSGRQLAVERSLVNEVFTTGYVQGVGATFQPMDFLKIHGSLNDGGRSGEELFGLRFHEDSTDLALTGRADVLLAGTWDQADDFTAWSGEPMGLVVGGGIHHEEGETGDTDANQRLTAWTLDAAYENQGWSAFAAANGMHTHDDDAGDAHQDIYGLLGQVGYNIDDTYQPFFRYEYLDLDLDTDGSYVNLATVGVNVYNNRHNAKFTADLVWAMDAIPPESLLNTGLGSLGALGLLPDGSADEEDQVALRLQYQLLF